uniref:Uncharacterized protein n=1 Tax=Oryza sativa subsp. japonica TaxID=39947 RepID=Q6YZ24_ORYSJ|nr:unknown protein [Oryza sativa Japonica Group]
MAAGRRGRGYGEVVATGTARPQCGGGALHGDDGAAGVRDGLGRRRRRSGVGGWPVTGFSGTGSSATTASGRRRLASGRRRLQSGSTAPTAADLAEGSRPAAVLSASGMTPPSPSLLFLQIRFSSSSVVLLPVLTGGAAPALLLPS